MGKTIGELREEGKSFSEISKIGEEEQDNDNSSNSGSSSSSSSSSSSNSSNSRDDRKTIGELRKEGKSFDEISRIGEKQIDREKVENSRTRVESDDPEDKGRTFAGKEIRQVSDSKKNREIINRANKQRRDLTIGELRELGLSSREISQIGRKGRSSISELKNKGFSQEDIARIGAVNQRRQQIKRSKEKNRQRSSKRREQERRFLAFQEQKENKQRREFTDMDGRGPSFNDITINRPERQNRLQQQTKTPGQIRNEPINFNTAQPTFSFFQPENASSNQVNLNPARVFTGPLQGGLSAGTYLAKNVQGKASLTGDIKKFGSQAISQPFTTAGSIGKSILNSIRTDPFGFLGGTLGSAGAGKVASSGVKAVGTKTARLDPRFKKLKTDKVTGEEKLEFPSTQPGRTNTEIKIAEGVKSTAEPLKEQVKRAGTKSDLVSAQRNFFGLRRQKTINKPKPTPDSDELETSFFLDPAGRLRKSRLGTQQDAGFSDILSGRFSFRREKPQAILIEQGEIEDLPKSLKDIKSSLKQNKQLSNEQLRRLREFQQTPSGKSKPIGFISEESEVTIPKGEVLKRKGTVAKTEIDGNIVPIIRSEIDQAPKGFNKRLSDFQKGKLSPQEARNFRKEFRDVTGFSSSDLQTSKPFLSPTKAGVTSSGTVSSGKTPGKSSSSDSLSLSSSNLKPNSNIIRTATGTNSNISPRRDPKKDNSSNILGNSSNRKGSPDRSSPGKNSPGSSSPKNNSSQGGGSSKLPPSSPPNGGSGSSGISGSSIFKPPQTPPQKPPKKVKPETPEKKTKRNVYDVYTKTPQGGLKLENKEPLPKNKALFLGTRITDNSSSTNSILVKTGVKSTSDIGLPGNLGKFETRRTGQGFNLEEKIRYRNDKPGERRDRFSLPPGQALRSPNRTRSQSLDRSRSQSLSRVRSQVGIDRTRSSSVRNSGNITGSDIIAGRMNNKKGISASDLFSTPGTQKRNSVSTNSKLQGLFFSRPNNSPSKRITYGSSGIVNSVNGKSLTSNMPTAQNKGFSRKRGTDNVKKTSYKSIFANEGIDNKKPQKSPLKQGFNDLTPNKKKNNSVQKGNNKVIGTPNILKTRGSKKKSLRL